MCARAHTCVCVMCVSVCAYVYVCVRRECVSPCGVCLEGSMSVRACVCVCEINPPTASAFKDTRVLMTEFSL